MKRIIAILFLGANLIYFTDSYCQSENPVIVKRHIENLSLLDENLFPKEKLINIKIDTVWNEFDSLPIVTGIEYFEKSHSRYYSNQTFNDSFKVYLIANSSDGDCAGGLSLIICEGNNILTEIEAGHGCGWETGSTKKYIIFIEDNVFKLVTESRMYPFDSNGKIVRDKYECKKKVETYKIALNGGLILLEESEDNWIDKK